MALSTTDKLNLALEIMSDRDVKKYEVVCSIAERNDIDIYKALEIFENKPK